MNNFKAYLKSKILLKNLLLAAGIAIVIVALLFLFMRIYTHHNRYVAVPDYKDLPIEDAIKYTEERKLRYEIFDSIFVSDREKGVVIDQHPKAGSMVKKRRRVYFTINAVSPEKISMPDLTGITLREARTKISIAGLNLGKLRYRYDMAKNVVLEQEFNGDPIEPGDTILKGSPVDLVLGKGLSNERTSVPDLIGLTYEAAQDKAADAFFTTSSPIADQTVIDEEELIPFVYRQHPVHSSSNLLPLGTQITVWVTLDSAKLEEFADSAHIDKTIQDYNEVDNVEDIEDHNTDYDYSD